MRDSIAEFIGRRISAQRRIARFSQRDLGAMAKISATGICLIELGRVLPPLDTLFRIADALGVTPMELIPRRQQVKGK